MFDDREAAAAVGSAHHRAALGAANVANALAHLAAAAVARLLEKRMLLEVPKDALAVADSLEATKQLLHVLARTSNDFQRHVFSTPPSRFRTSFGSNLDNTRAGPGPA
jgi:hypothetical protein